MQESKSQKFTAIVLMDLPESDPDFEILVRRIKNGLVNKGILLLTLPNPFYFQQVQTRLEPDQKLNAKTLSDLVRERDEFSRRVSSKLKAAGLLTDFVFPNMDATAKQWLNSEYAVADAEAKEHLTDLKENLGSEIYLYRLSDFEAPQIRIQASVLKPVGGVNDVRINEPLRALATFPGVISRASRLEKPISTSGNRLNKVFIFHRPILTLDKGLQVIQKLREEGYLIITEFDDHHSPWPLIEQNKFLNFVGCHAVQTTTEPLAELFGGFNPEVGVFPNQLNQMPGRDLREPSKTSNIFFGALNREKDWAPILPAINKMLQKVSGDYHFNVVFDQKFFDALETDKKSFYPQCAYPEYLNILSEADIALLPLEDNLFNRMKSDLKLVEVAGSGAVPIASPVVYKKSDPEGEFVEFARAGSEFAEKLQKLIEDALYRHERQIAARNYVRQSRLLHLHVHKRYQWLLGLLERRAELDDLLAARLTAL